MKRLPEFAHQAAVVLIVTALKNFGRLFYPIVPGREEESWRIFKETIIEQFLSGQYTQHTEAKFLTDFEKALPKTPPWE